MYPFIKCGSALQVHAYKYSKFKDSCSYGNATCDQKEERREISSKLYLNQYVIYWRIKCMKHANDIYKNINIENIQVYIEK